MKKIVSIQMTVMLVICHVLLQAPPEVQENFEQESAKSSSRNDAERNFTARQATAVKSNVNTVQNNQQPERTAVSKNNTVTADARHTGGISFVAKPMTERIVNKDGSTTETTQRPDDSIHQITRRTDGSTEEIVMHPDDSSVETTTHANGTKIEVQTHADGTIITTRQNPDSSMHQITKNTDGSTEEVLVGSDNSSVETTTKLNGIKIEVVKGSDGKNLKKTTTKNDGTTSVETRDASRGTKTKVTTAPDGTISEAVTMKDGSSKTNILYKNKTSINVVKQADGTQSVTTKDYQPTEGDADDLQKGNMTPGSILAAKQAIGITDLSSDNLTDKDIKTAYRKSSLKYHPDKSAGKSADEVAVNSNKFTAAKNAQDLLLQRTNTASSTAA